MANANLRSDCEGRDDRDDCHDSKSQSRDKGPQRPAAVGEGEKDAEDNGKLAKGGASGWPAPDAALLSVMQAT
ncbi:hypothetical protein CFE70_007546 [Pyrenophora teres f. teres 0-1]